MSARAECGIGDCARPVKARGWCGTHWRRWRIHGDPEVNPRPQHATTEESFTAGVEPLVWTDCLVWVRGGTPAGYGSIRHSGKMIGVHRYAWERENGPIPEGMEVDHVCHVRSCVNVEHLRLATRAQNCSNLAGARRGHRLPRGVFLTPAGTYGSRVKHEGIEYRVGTFSTAEEADMAVITKRRELKGEFAGKGGNA